MAYGVWRMVLAEEHLGKLNGHMPGANCRVNVPIPACRHSCRRRQSAYTRFVMAAGCSLDCVFLLLLLLYSSCFTLAAASHTIPHTRLIYRDRERETEKKRMQVAPTRTSIACPAFWSMLHIAAATQSAHKSTLPSSGHNIPAQHIWSY